MRICTTCRREVEVGQRVLRNYVMTDVPFTEADPRYQHANCYDADGPRYNEDGTEEEIVVKGYIPRQIDQATVVEE